MITNYENGIQGSDFLLSLNTKLMIYLKNLTCKECQEQLALPTLLLVGDKRSSVSNGPKC
jgi:hypothetical protein